MNTAYNELEAMRTSVSADDGSIELTVVMPCLNEAETLARCIQKAQDFFKRSGISGEVVIGDNGSTDGSQAIALELGARVISIPLRGYGAALYGATLAARGKYCIMGDSDDSYDFLSLEPFVESLRAGNDLVMGNRFRGGIQPGAMPWKNRYLGNPVLSAIGNTLFRSPAGDFHCGIRGYSKAAFERMDLRTTGMEFASEMVIKATLMRMRIAEVPTTLSPDGRSRPPHLRPWRDGWRHLRFMMLFSPNWLFLYPGMLLVLIGLILGGLLLIGSVQVGSVRLGIDTLIYCGFMVVIGFQAVLFSSVSRAYAVQEGLYPKYLASKRPFSLSHLEINLVIGSVLLLAGLIVAFSSIFQWGHRSFGMMDVEPFVRYVVFSCVSMTVGLEIMLSSLLVSTLKLGVRHHTAGKLRELEPADIPAFAITTR